LWYLISLLAFPAISVLGSLVLCQTGGISSGTGIDIGLDLIIVVLLILLAGLPNTHWEAEEP
jgi:hypothetical protein